MERKEIVKLLGEHFGVKPKYMGAPSFAYQIETTEGVMIIDKAGKVENSEGVVIELEELLRNSEEVQVKEEAEDSEVTFLMEEHTGISLRNLINMIASKQTLIKKAMEIENDIVTEAFIKGINDVRIVGVEDFKIVAIEIGLEKCQGIKFDFKKGILQFKFVESFENTKTANQFAEALNESSKKIKYSSAKERQTDNEKYTFRTWLLRLGFIGNRYKEARNQLLKNLNGNGSFRNKKEDIKIR
ncbi:virulence-related protein [Clostridium guangxiense]|uniref:virulence-related protein n=1 Tax=Clostridium guangxiense TaxID=1662055 RepID=UPI001E4B0E0B|nr:virulence-related protein [Clostridium guangxiense]MCD2347198.1 virulence-related protein [Clostridium guangxiense]